MKTHILVCGMSILKTSVLCAFHRIVMELSVLILGTERNKF